MHKLNTIKKLFVMLGVLALPAAAFADIAEPDIADMLTNLQSLINPMLSMLLAASLVMGIFFLLKGLMKLKAFALPLTQTTQPGDFSGPMIYIFVGAVMIYIPTSTDVLTNTLFGSSGTSIFSGNTPNVATSSNTPATALMGYVNVTLESQWATLINTVVYYMQFIGFIAFMRGWVLITHAAQHHGGQDNLSKGIIHIIGGILAINFVPLVNAVTTTISGTS